MDVRAGAHRTVTAHAATHAAAGGAEALALEHVHKRFGEVVALEDASLRVRAGTLHALLGENGAGKTTLLRVAFGLLRADRGTVRLHGVARRLASPRDAIALGLGMVHQHFTLVPALTVAENVALGGHGRYRRRDARERVMAIGRETGLTLDPDALVRDLGVAGQQRVEIVKALAHGARVLVLDEPTAVLAPDEAAELLRWLRRYVDAGHAAVLITHKLNEALAHAHDVTVLRRGRTVLAAPAASLRTDDLVDAMVGPPTPDDAPGDASNRALAGEMAVIAMAAAHAPGAIVLAAHRLDVRDMRSVRRVREASLDVRAGEIVGLAGVDGAGQRELLRALAGRMPPAAGELVRPPSVAFVPEDRHRDALVLDASLTENVALRGAGARRGLVPWGALRARTGALLAEHDVRAPGPTTPVHELSGGNQQKLVLARELSDAPAAVVAENPTRGLDVRATAAVHAQLRAARARGAAVLVYSSDLDELLALADRVLVMHAGEVHATVATRDAVGRAMLGAAVPAAVPTATPAP